jgi:hypothetical protein
VPTVTRRWIHGPVVDTAVAWCWVPFFLAGRAIESRPDALATLVVAVFILSFSHQPLTLTLVYGDPDQFRARRALFTWSPLVFLVAVVGGVALSVALVAVIAGLWNAEHTLMQRYGVTRIYGRKVASNGPSCCRGSASRSCGWRPTPVRRPASTVCRSAK